MNTEFPLHVVVLAAGQGTRMKSDLPKVLHRIAGKPMLSHVVSVAEALHAASIQVVYGHGGEKVQQALSGLDLSWVEQKEQLGTGHAVQQAVPGIPDESRVLILYGDVPLINQETLQTLVDLLVKTDLSLLTVQLDNPTGYGRIMRNEHRKVYAIVEEKDADPDQKRVNEVNTGMMAVNGRRLKQWLSNLDNNNHQGEYYLTDVISMAVEDGCEVMTCSPTHTIEVEGVNNKMQLARLERAYQRHRAEQYMEQGVTLIDPNRFDLRGTLEIGRDVVIDVNAIFEGRVTIGNNVSIGANAIIKDSDIADDAEILPNSIIDGAKIGNACVIGPFARIRPDTVLAESVKIGNFVEVKKAQIAKKSKVNHLSYVGDTKMGAHVNVGAGTITCNYDGANKHETIIGDNVFIGSDTQLVAPVHVGEGATIGAGSTITHDVPSNELTLSRSQQKTRKGWKRPVKRN